MEERRNDRIENIAVAPIAVWCSSLTPEVLLQTLIWPSARPDDVFINPTDTLNQRVPWARPSGKYSSDYSQISSHEDMVNAWYKYGFVVRDQAFTMSSCELIAA